MKREQFKIANDMICCSRPINFELRRFFINSFISNTMVSPKTKAYLQYLKTRVHSSTSFIRQRCRCRITGRSRFVITSGCMVRLTFRYYSGLGHFRGIARTGF